MARPTLNSRPKYKRLIAMLDLPRPYVRGLLETLWESAHETGNPVIGTPEDVEAAAEWTGEPGAFAAALIELRFLDPATDDETDVTDVTEGTVTSVAPSRWELHDYFDHAPDYAKDRGRREQERRSVKSCDACGTDFRSSDPRSKYCSSACRKKAWRDRQSQNETDVTDRDGSRRNGTESDGTPAPAPTPLKPESARAKPPAPETDPETDISEEQAAFELFEKEYPPHRFTKIHEIQRTFHRLWRNGQLPPMAEFFATLAAWKRCSDWRKGFILEAHKWLESGAYTRPPKTPVSRRPPVVKAGPTEAEIKAMSPAERDAYFESLGGGA